MLPMQGDIGDGFARMALIIDLITSFIPVPTLSPEFREINLKGLKTEQDPKHPHNLDLLQFLSPQT